MEIVLAQGAVRYSIFIIYCDVICKLSVLLLVFQLKNSIEKHHERRKMT